MSEAGSGWTPGETAALVDAYIWMWMNDRAGRRFVKAHLVRSLMAGPVSGRTKQSIEYKLRNVSKVFADFKLPYVKGYLPLDNASEDLGEFVQLAFGRLASRLESDSPRMWG
jgi:5-methylcytosine-specific restriction protein A